MDIEAIMKYEALIAIAIGVFLCLFGYRIKKVAFIIIWFAIGYYLTSLIAPQFIEDPTWRQLLPIAVGVITGVLGFSLEKICIFAVAAFSVSTTIIDLFQMTEVLPIAVAIAAGVVVGCIAVSFIKPLGIITTALSGSKLIAKYSVAQFALAHNPNFLIILAIAAAIGIVFQFKNCRHIE